MRMFCFLTQRDRPSRFFDFFPGCRADFIGFYLQAVFQFSVTKNFDSHEITADELRLAEKLLVNRSPSLKCVEIIEVDDRVSLVKGGVIKSSLWQPPNQRHLPAFEPKANTPTGARLLSLMTLATGFSVTGAFTAAQALYPMSRTGTRLQIMKTHHVAHLFHR